jgi:hypothetical protein
MGGTLDNDDNDSETWITLKAATLNVVLWLKTQKQSGKQCKGDADAGDCNEQDGVDDRENVQARLNELGAVRK